MDILVKFDDNGYPRSTCLVEAFDEELMGPREDYVLVPVEDVRAATKATAPPAVEGK